MERVAVYISVVTLNQQMVIKINDSYKMQQLVDTVWRRNNLYSRGISPLVCPPQINTVSMETNGQCNQPRLGPDQLSVAGLKGPRPCRSSLGMRNVVSSLISYCDFTTVVTVRCHVFNMAYQRE